MGKKAKPVAAHTRLRELQGTLLVVDDDAQDLKTMSDILQEELRCCRILTASGPEEARKAVTENKVNVVITDMRLEDDAEGGYEVLLELRNADPHIQVIVLTNFPDCSNAVRCMRAGCVDYFDKSVHPRDITARVAEALQLSRSGPWRASLAEALIRANWEMALQETDRNKKGKYLEELVFHVFRSVPGWANIEKRVKNRAEEFDLVIRNESDDEFWRRCGNFILVECKNWVKKRPDRKEMDAFAAKIRRRGDANSLLGFFVSLNGVSDGFIEYAKWETPLMVVVFDKAALWDLIAAPDRNEWLKRRISDQTFRN